MAKLPTYTALEIKNLCLNVEVNIETFDLIAEILDEELDLYSEDDLVILMEASMIMFSRCMLEAALNILNRYQN